jgi:hypothetical protein
MSIRSIDILVVSSFTFWTRTNTLGHHYVGSALTDVSQTPPESFEPGHVTEYEQNE